MTPHIKRALRHWYVPEAHAEAEALYAVYSWAREVDDADEADLPAAREGLRRALRHLECVMAPHPESCQCHGCRAARGVPS